MSDPDGGLQLVAYFGLDWTGETTHPVDQLADFVTAERIKEVWIAAPWDDRDLLESSFNAMNESVVDVHVTLISISTVY